MISFGRARPLLERFADSAFAALVWWVEGIRLGMPPRLRAGVFRPRERFLVRIEGERLLIRSVRESDRSSGTDEAETELSVSPGQLTDLPESAEVVLVLPREVRLTTDVDVPCAAEHELRSLIYHELDRLTPFPIDECAFDYRIHDGAPESPTRRAEVALVRRRDLEGLVERARTSAVVPTAVTAENAAGEIMSIDLSRGRRRARRFPFRLSRPPCRPVLAAVAATALLAAAYIPLGRYSTQLRTYEAIVEEQRAAAVDARGMLEEARAAEAGARLLEQRRHEYERPLDLLAALTRRIPEDTWVSRLSLSGTGVQLQGEAAAAAAILEVVESLDDLESAEFQAPVARNDANGKDRFTITAAWAEAD